MKILVINGPNLNLLGERDPKHYGTQTLPAIERRMEERANEYGWEIEFHRTNHEGEIIDLLHGSRIDCDAVILNAGAYTHTSVALHDCIRSLKCPVIEVHISNVHQREDFRHKSMISAACKGVICGFGLDSYRLAIEALRP